MMWYLDKHGNNFTLPWTKDGIKDYQKYAGGSSLLYTLTQFYGLFRINTTYFTLSKKMPDIMMLDEVNLQWRIRNTPK
jgi:hypothetical protein